MRRSVMYTILALTFLIGGPLFGSVAWAGGQSGSGGQTSGGRTISCIGTFEYFDLDAGLNASEVYVAVRCDRATTVAAFFGAIGPLNFGDTIGDQSDAFIAELGDDVAAAFDEAGGVTVLSVEHISIETDTANQDIFKPARGKQFQSFYLVVTLSLTGV